MVRAETIQLLEENCHGSLNVSWKRISRHRESLKSVSLLRARSSDNHETLLEQRDGSGES